MSVSSLKQAVSSMVKAADDLTLKWRTEVRVHHIEVWSCNIFDMVLYTWYFRSIISKFHKPLILSYLGGP
jgi:hypothetical protein